MHTTLRQATGIDAWLQTQCSPWQHGWASRRRTPAALSCCRWAGWPAAAGVAAGVLLLVAGRLPGYPQLPLLNALTSGARASRRARLLLPPPRLHRLPRPPAAAAAPARAELCPPGCAWLALAAPRLRGPAPPLAAPARPPASPLGPLLSAAAPALAPHPPPPAAAAGPAPAPQAAAATPPAPTAAPARAAWRRQPPQSPSPPH